MIKTAKEVVIDVEKNSEGKVIAEMSRLRDFKGLDGKIGMYSHVKLAPGEKVDFHVHIKEMELYYIMAGKGLYDDNGKKIEVEPGTITFTASGEGHGLENTGDCMLEFMALEVKI